MTLLRVGFALPFLLPGTRCALTAPFHPYPRFRGRCIFCGTFRRVAPPSRYEAHCPEEFGLSSILIKNQDRDCLTASDKLYIIGKGAIMHPGCDARRRFGRREALQAQSQNEERESPGHKLRDRRHDHRISSEDYSIAPAQAVKISQFVIVQYVAITSTSGWVQALPMSLFQDWDCAGTVFQGFPASPFQSSP